MEIVSRWVIALVGLRLITALLGPAPLPTWTPRWSPWWVTVLWVGASVRLS